MGDLIFFAFGASAFTTAVCLAMVYKSLVIKLENISFDLDISIAKMEADLEKQLLNINAELSSLKKYSGYQEVTQRAIANAQFENEKLKRQLKSERDLLSQIEVSFEKFKKEIGYEE